MLLTIILLLVILWALGYGFAGAALGGVLHILLVIALVILIYYAIAGRRPPV